jgi:UDP-glucose 4-epimerase
MDLHGKYTEVLIRWMQRLDAGERPIIFGDGADTLDLIHVGDIARANLLAAASPSTDRVYNVGSGREISLAALARRLAAVMDRPDLLPELQPRRVVNPVARRLADTAAAEREIGFRAAIAIDDGLSDLVDWWREAQRDPTACTALETAQ